MLRCLLPLSLWRQVPLLQMLLPPQSLLPLLKLEMLLLLVNVSPLSSETAITVTHVCQFV